MGVEVPEGPGSGYTGSMASSPPLVSFLGWSDSGKTTLITALIEEAARRGLSCAAAKVTRHAGDLEPPGKDSARFRAAGASPVAFVGTGGAALTALYLPTPPAPDRAWILGLFPGADLVLVEGLELDEVPSVLVVGRGQEPKRDLDRVVLVVTEDEGLRTRCVTSKTPVFAPGEVGPLLDAVLALCRADKEKTWKGK